MQPIEQHRLTQAGWEAITSGDLDRWRIRMNLSYRALAERLGTYAPTAKFWCQDKSTRVHASSCLRVGKFMRDAVSDEAALTYLGLTWDDVVGVRTVTAWAGISLLELRVRAANYGVRTIELVAAGDVFRRQDLSHLGVMVPA